MTVKINVVMLGGVCFILFYFCLSFEKLEALSPRESETVTADVILASSLYHTRGVTAKPEISRSSFKDAPTSAQCYKSCT